MTQDLDHVGELDTDRATDLIDEAVERFRRGVDVPLSDRPVSPAVRS